MKLLAYMANSTFRNIVTPTVFTDDHSLLNFLRLRVSNK